jgi:hypothetical protein
MSTILIITTISIAILIIRAILKRDRNWDGSMKKTVSFEYVKSKLHWRKNIAFKHCPKCGLESTELDWFEFRTSNNSWRHLAGREGFYSMCPNCKIVVEDIITLMN